MASSMFASAASSEVSPSRSALYTSPQPPRPAPRICPSRLATRASVLVFPPSTPNTQCMMSLRFPLKIPGDADAHSSADQEGARPINSHQINVADALADIGGGLLPSLRRLLPLYCTRKPGDGSPAH